MTDLCVTFFWPAMSSFADDGALIMRATGYEADCHWTGQHRVAPDNPDFALWCLFREAFHASPPLLPFVSNLQLPAIREEWQREQACSHTAEKDNPEKQLFFQE